MPKALTNPQDAYKLLRFCYLSIFERDKLKTATDANMRIISTGNAWAWGGDASGQAKETNAKGIFRQRE
jgi:hypothetical protein